MENADKNDDIDLMVVTSKNCLWIVRPLATLLVSLFFKRRYPLPNAETNPACRRLERQRLAGR